MNNDLIAFREPENTDDLVDWLTYDPFGATTKID